MTDISKRLAEIRERDDLVHDLHGNGWDDHATDAEMDRAVLLAAAKRVHEWATSDLAPTAINEFGSGYREAMRDIRDLLAAALETGGGEADA